MRQICVIGAAIAVAVLGTGAFAQTLGSSSGPAEIPPASYTGNQYVDSKGCVFVRAGVSGNVRWVPRVTRSRNVICNQTPTNATTRRVATAAPAATPVVRTAPVVAAAAAPRAVQTTRRVQAAPVQVSRVVTQRPVQTHIQHAPVAVTRNVVNFDRQCGNRSTTGNLYTNTGSGVRCGPQKWHPSHAGRIINAPSITVQPPVVTQRVVRADVPRRLTHGSNTVRGYEYTWDDGRLNPSRGLRNTVVGRTGAVVKANPVYHAPRATVSTRSYAPQVVQRAAPVQRSYAGAGHRFVQVGTFGVPSNAQRSLRRLQGMGLPARIQRSGRYSVVLAGPFNGGSLQSALNQARRSGFHDAFTRR